MSEPSGEKFAGEVETSENSVRENEINENPHEWLKRFIKDVRDFPTPGILFKDICPLLADKNAFQHTVQKLAELAWHANVEAVVAMESRGFLFGAPVAFSLGVPFIPVRKKGKLPGETIFTEYKLEYGSSVLEMSKDCLVPNLKVAVIDDVLATGGTAVATKTLVEMLGAEVATFLFLIELEFLDGRKKLGATPSSSLIKY